jgi:hypothetical protein
MKYIDVRGPWPTYVNGVVAIQLVGADRSITVEEAEAILKKERQDGQVLISGVDGEAAEGPEQS